MECNFGSAGAVVKRRWATPIEAALRWMIGGAFAAGAPERATTIVSRRAQFPWRGIGYPVRMGRKHEYTIHNRWTGNLGSGTSHYRTYSRAYELTGTEKAIAIPGSSDPVFRGDRSRYNPEELLLGALSGCHMLWVLHLCADAGITVTEYMDDAWGEMKEHPDGAGEFTRAILRPRMGILEADRIPEAIAIHQKAHALCAMARSVNFPVEHQPEVKASLTKP